MGTKVQIENCLPGQSSTRDLTCESNGGGWPSCYTGGSLPNPQFHYGYLARTTTDKHPGYDKDVLKQTMLEHEAIFKDQVYELHRLYRVQRGLMDEVKRKDPLTWGMPSEASSSSSPVPSHLQFDDSQRWNGSSFPLASPCSGRPLISGPDTVQSSPNSVKGKSILAGPSPSSSPFHNCYSPKTSEASEARPTKFRKRILDLQLPADEYIDTDEVDQFGSAKDLPISKRKALADLNEPLHVEETSAFSSFGILGHSGRHSDSSCRDLPAKLFSSSKDTPQNSKKLSHNGTSKNLPEIRANGQDWYRHALGSEQPKASVRSIDQEVHPEKAHVVSRPVQILRSEHIKKEPWKTDAAVLSQNSYHYPMSNHHILGSHVSRQTGLSWDQSAWGKPNLPTSKPISIQQSLFQSSVHSNGFFGKWDQNSSHRPNTAVVGEPRVRNGFSQGSSVAFKEIPACFPKAGYDYVNSNYNENRASRCNNVNPVRDINLNETLPSGVFSDKIVDKDCKPKDPLSVLPWLKGKGGIEAKISENCQKNLGVSIFGNPLKQKKESLDSSHQSRYEEVGCSKRKHLFDMNLPCDDSSDSDVGKMAIDEVVAENKECKSVSFRNQFDLNCCITEEVGTGIDLEALISLENENEHLSGEHSLIKEREKQPPGVRLENSADDGDAKSAASAIVAMSFWVKTTQSSMEERICLPPETEGDDPLHWFVSIACSTRNDDGLDDFEYMILRLKECTPEEYFPKPSIPDFTFIENNSTCMLTSRTRKGQGRRGRLKRDFQRDILPGLTTLSRHEVTEDLQTFGELMRATGFSWQSGPNRRNAARNGRGRGRRRYVETTLVLDETVCALPLKQQEVHSDIMEVSIVDRSLTGWGKTTRRPRRQRCPAGNHALQVTLT